MLFMVIRYMLAVVAPPLAVLSTGRFFNFLLSLLLTLGSRGMTGEQRGLGAIILLLAIIHACVISAQHHADIRDGRKEADGFKGGLTFLLIIIVTAVISVTAVLLIDSRKKSRPAGISQADNRKQGIQSRRDWTDSQGRTIQAKLISKSSTSVTLEGADGKTKVIPLESFSQADQEYVRQLK
jgi:hypothetical protein